ncbi:MAG TPA: glycosyltransferase family 39 protein [Vicinamibacteria bacterium]
MRRLPSGPRWLQWAAPLLLLVPFLGKALHIDDPFFVRYAQLIREQPLDPFGQQFWYFGSVTSVFAQPQPLGWSYVLAVSIRWLGTSEVALHLPALAFAALALCALGSLARRAGVSVAVCCWLYAGSSGFLVMGASVGPYMAWAALTLSALALVVRGTDGDRPRDLVAGGLAAGAAFLCCYAGSVLLLLLPLYALLARRPRHALPPVLAAGAVMAGADVWSTLVHGAPHFLSTIDAWSLPLSRLYLVRAVVSDLVQLGGQLPAPGFALFVVVLAMGRGWILALLSLGTALGLGWARPREAPWMAAVLFAWPALAVLFAAVLHAAREMVVQYRGRAAASDPFPAFVCVWLLVTGFATLRYVHVAAKYFLVPLPAAILLLLMALARLPEVRARWGARLVRVSVPCTVALGLMAGLSDARWAETYRRTFAHGPSALAPLEGTAFINAEWGLRYYGERAGLRVYKGEELQPGDRVLYSPTVVKSADLPRQLVTPVGTLALDHAGPLALMAGGAGFYSNHAGAYPYLPAARLREEVTALEHVDVEAVPRALVACDDPAQVYFNGRDLGPLIGLQTVLSLPLATPGRQVVAVTATGNTDLPSLIGVLIVPGPTRAVVPALWRCSGRPEPGWTMPAFDDGGWKRAQQLARHSAPPWGHLDDAFDRAWWFQARLPRRPRQTVYCRWEFRAEKGA